METERRKSPRSLMDEHKESHRVHHFLLKVGLVYAAISMALFFVFASLLSKHAYDDMSNDEINHISEMVFESMYTAMLAGQDRAGIAAAAKRMDETGPGMQTSVIRGEVVAELFGEDELDKMRRLNDLAIFDVFKTGQEKVIQGDMGIRYLYPAHFRQQCLQCHLNSKPDQVAGVIEINYPITNLKVSTSYVELLMLAYFGSSFIVLIVFLSWSFRRK
jgi:hypothetical protein